MEDGTILVTGGHISNFGNHLGRRDVNIFNPDVEAPQDKWTVPNEDMVYRRWYPTNTTLANGKVLTVTGSNRYCNGGTNNNDECIEHDDCGNHGNCENNVCDGGDQNNNACNGNSDCLNNTGTCDRVKMAIFPELYDPAAKTWETLNTAGLAIPFYPFNYVLPDGRVFYAGAEVRIGTGIDISGRNTYVLNVNNANPVWSFVDLLPCVDKPTFSTERRQ